MDKALTYPALACGLLLLSVTLSRSQPTTITTLAGSAGQGSANGTGAHARFANPWGVASDASGNLYVADTDNHIVRKVASSGVVSTLAGLAGVSGSADATGSNARFNQPQGIAVDGAGNVYVADTGNHTIRKITAGGAVSTLAGSAGIPGSADGTGSAARFYEPEGIAVDASGNLYVADTWNHTIRKITSGGSVSTLAGLASTSGSTDGAGSGALFCQPQGVAVDGAGNVYVGDTGNQTIRRITSDGSVSTLAGSAGGYGSTDAPGSSASFWAPQGVALDTATNLYVADSFNNTIREITPSGVVTTLAGAAGSFGSADATNTSARFWLPQSVAVDGSNNIYVADSANSTIRKIASGLVTTVAGSASTGSTNGTGSSARFYWPEGAAVDGSGNIYVADTGNATIRKVTSAGVVTTVAGSAGSFGSTDATGAEARFYGPQGIAADSNGNLYVADTANHTIRKVSSAGVVTTLAGSAGTNGLADGLGSSARFNYPQGVAVDTSGNVYVADTWNHTIRKVTSGGQVTTLAGVPGCYGDLDSASAGNGTNTARFNCPSGIAADTAGNLYVADTRNHTIRQMTSGGVVSTLAGMPGVCGNADGTNSDARFNQPQGISVDSSGNLYVLDSGNHTVRRVAPVGGNWVATTIAGLPGVSGSADGTASDARFFYPSGIGINSAGAFYVADWGNNTIRASGSYVVPQIVDQPQDQSANQGQDATFSAMASGSTPLAYQWLFCGTYLAGATASDYTRTNAQPADAGPYSVIVTNNYGSITSSTATLTVIQPPVATNLTADTCRNQPWSIPVASLLLHASDPDGDPLSLSSVSGASTNGGLVALDAGAVTYTPALNFIGADRFTYTVSDIYGVTASAFVLVTVNADSALIPNMLAPANVDGGMFIAFTGATGCTYSVQRALTLPGVWVTLGSTTVNSTGIGTFLDANAPTNSAFYRTTYPEHGR